MPADLPELPGMDFKTLLLEFHSEVQKLITESASY